MIKKKEIIHKKKYSIINFEYKNKICIIILDSYITVNIIII